MQGGFIILWQRQSENYQRGVFIDTPDKAFADALAKDICDQDGCKEAVIYQTKNHWRSLFHIRNGEVEKTADKGTAA